MNDFVKHGVRRALREVFGRSRALLATTGWRGRSTWTILAGHEVGDWNHHLPEDMRIAPWRLESQIAWWSSRATFLDVESALERASVAGDSRRCFVSLTFDDGYRGLKTHLVPLLRKMGLRANVYVHTGTWRGDFLPWTDLYFLLLTRLGIERLASELELPPRASAFSSYSLKVALKNVFDERERRDRLERSFRREFGDPRLWQQRIYLRPEELRPLEDVLQFGSHTVTHPRLATLTVDERREELERSRCALESVLGHPVTTFAFPFGRELDVPDTADVELPAAGYTVGLTMTEGTNVLPLGGTTRLRRWPLDARFRPWELEALQCGGLDRRWLRR
ncbi:MAG: polysaccharide deacetylase family protein [Planctomycetes bacterium]|nr:polysaccharide deacetylase family protein [Planctomycetota bacterium]